MRATRRAVPQVVETREAAPVFDRRYDLCHHRLAGGGVLRFRSSSAACVMRSAATPGNEKILVVTHLNHK